MDAVGDCEGLAAEEDAARGIGDGKFDAKPGTLAFGLIKIFEKLARLAVGEHDLIVSAKRRSDFARVDFEVGFSQQKELETFLHGSVYVNVLAIAILHEGGA